MITKTNSNQKKYHINLIFPIVIIFFLSFLFTFFMSKSSGDDLVFLDRLNSLGYITASSEYYNIWSSRIIIEFFLMFFSKHFFLWKLFNPVVMTGTVWLLNKYTLNESTPQNLFLTFGLYSMIPLTLMRETGWVATTLNYHWAIFFALLAFYPFYKKLNNEKIPVVLYGISIISMIYASSQEQINLCFLVFTLLLSFYLIKVHRYDIKLSVLNIISIIGLSLFIFSPGNDIRLSSEISHWFPEYADFSTLNKLDLGISSFGKPFFIDSNLLFFSLFLLVSLLVYQKKINYYLKLLCALPLAFNAIIYLGGTMQLGFTFYGLNSSSAIFSNENLNKWFLKTGTGLSLDHPTTWIPTLLILFFVVCLTIGLFLCFDNQKIGIIADLLFLMAISSRVIMGFSPTVWASGVRPYLITFIIAVILIMLLLNEFKKLNPKKTDSIIFIFTILGICTFFLSVFSK